MSKIFIMCAAPGSGKSYWVNHHKFEGSVKVVSRDEIRFNIVQPDEPYFSKEKEVFRDFIAEIKEGLDWADNVVIDATHINPTSRNKLFKAIGKLPSRINDVIAVVISTPINLVLEQNQNRHGTRSFVPEDVIRNMRSQFVEPCFEEGFTEIWTIKREVDL